MIGKLVIYSAMGVCGFGITTSAIKYRMEYAVRNELYPEVDLDNKKVSIHLSTLNEEQFIVPTLESLINQRLYIENRDKIELVLVDSYSEDNTIKLAEPYVDRILKVNRGKLTARREAIEQSPSADIIVSVDSGDWYPPNWLHLMLRHFSDEDVVAVTCSEISMDDSPIHIQVGVIWANVIHRRLQGRGMAIKREAFFECGGWNESINQQNIKELWQEEEFNLYTRMKKVGKVITDYEAVVYCPPRRFLCSYKPDEIFNYCEAIESGQRF